MLTPHYADDTVTLHHGDCLDVLRELPDNSVDAVVTDPPYGLEFMGREWDSFGKSKGGASILDPADDRWNNAYSKARVTYHTGGATLRAFGAWCEQWATECLRVLKPGGHLLAFGGTRTWHRLACAVEDAGFEVRDSIAWLYGSGFPKSLDVSKAIDKAAGATREVVGVSPHFSPGRSVDNFGVEGVGGLTEQRDRSITAPATDDARTWQGWGTALKPAFEPVVVGRKPLAGTVAANVLAHGTGALNIDGCRVEGVYDAPTGGEPVMDNNVFGKGLGVGNGSHALGRWPANVVLSQDAADELDRQSGTLTSGANPTRRGSDKFRDAYGEFAGQEQCTPARGVDSGGASRFFPVFQYAAKAPTVERPRDGETAHPTVKPLDLMRWLVRLVTPPGGTVLEPFAGSGTTVEACIAEGFRCVAVEREADYLPLIEQRIARRRANPAGPIARPKPKTAPPVPGALSFLDDDDFSDDDPSTDQEMPA